MAENENQSTAVEEAQVPYAITIEDAGPATKKVTVEIPHERIEKKLSQQFKELRQQAQVPGFRKGHAPAKLLEKKFGTDVKNEVRTALIRESYSEALEKNSLNVIGEPEFDNADKIELPDTGPLSYSFQVEIQPDFTIPDLKGIKVRKPRVQVTDNHVDQAMNNLREQQGTIVPVEDRGVEAKDIVIADVHVRQHSNVIAHHHDIQIQAVPAVRIAGYPIEEFDKKLEGAKSEESRTITVTAPDNHPAESVRGQEVQIEITVKDIKKLELAEINQTFLDSLGFTSEQELRDALREQMVERINSDVQRSMRQQVLNYLLEKTEVTVPTKLSQRQTDRIVQRRAVDLMMRGMPREQVQANIDRLRGGADQEAARELKSFFILQKIATEQNVDVSEQELNGRVAYMAIQEGKRPERVKQDMSKDGSLANLYVQMREEKAIDKILGESEIEEYDATAAEAAKSAEAPGEGEAAAEGTTEASAAPTEEPKAEDHSTAT